MMALATPTATAKVIKSAIELFPSDASADVGGDANCDDQQKDHRALLKVIHFLLRWLMVE